MTYNLIGDINHEALKTFMDWVHGTEEDEILLNLSSDGGHSGVGLAFYDFLQSVRKLGVEVTIVAYGQVSSAAVAVFAAGDKRYMSKNSTLFVHESSSEDGGSVTRVKRDLAVNEAVDRRYDAVMASASTIPAEKWKTLSESETTLTPEECLEMGLCHKII